MRNNFKKLEQFARERGYTVSRRGREIEWRCNARPDRQGSCSGVSEAEEEIGLDHGFRLKHDRRD